ncbi:hypothetical protein ASD79_11800 [Caulobacter sp. Root655]|uniref:DUF4287 domain-containing protein n=1 Tax=Caulobacter sp. Root655 TaxID=1736578 RepID=UPI0006FB3E30|nr:DUF4287 domain-containing protein [Caulobacter sp. Root655]KRA59363.1 hypothetical protein ASD79_11800 [Caulobacter sp. Root655]
MTEQLTERQAKWFASVQASLERDTGKSLAQWVEIVRRDCTETRPRARTQWLKEVHGLGVNRAAHILSAAFPEGPGWDDADALRAALWTDPAATAILRALEAAVADFPGMVSGQRKAFSAWSHKVQFAAAKPVRGGTAMLGLALTPEASPRLSSPKNESWSERLKAKLALASPSDVDDEVRALLKAAWERS